ncbi:MAG: ribosomal RNA small subunit methyltransferase I, partial [Patescibacteria group bacterium]
MIGTLYIVATPIGNLADITFRAIETLKSVDLILCEDTRVTAKLLARYDIKKPLMSYHQHSKSNKVDWIIGLLGEGKSLALVTDAGTPGISDPGNILISELGKGKDAGIEIFPVPGVSAVTTALSISGLP